MANWPVFFLCQDFDHNRSHCATHAHTHIIIDHALAYSQLPYPIFLFSSMLNECFPLSSFLDWWVDRSNSESRQTSQESSKIDTKQERDNQTEREGKEANMRDQRHRTRASHPEVDCSYFNAHDRIRTVVSLRTI